MSLAALQPGLAADGVVLRPYRAADAERLCAAVAASRAELAPWLPWCRMDYSLDDAESFVFGRAGAWVREEEFSFAITAEADGRFLGGCGLNEINRARRAANLGYWVRTDATGRGVASTAARLLARFGLEQVGLQRIEILAAVENIASQRAALRAGARREGVLFNRLLVHERFHDAVAFSFVAGNAAQELTAAVD